MCESGFDSHLICPLCFGFSQPSLVSPLEPFLRALGLNQYHRTCCYADRTCLVNWNLTLKPLFAAAKQHFA